jgi:hypothetical protein
VLGRCAAVRVSGVRPPSSDHCCERGQPVGRSASQIKPGLERRAALCMCARPGRISGATLVTQRHGIPLRFLWWGDPFVIG